MSRSRTGPSLKSLLKMRALGALGVAGVLAFYVAWPLYAGYDLKTALDGRNVEALNARVDFERVRASLRPAVTAKVDKAVTDALRRFGTAGGALADRLEAKTTARIVDGVLASLVTPEMLIRIHASGRTFKEALDGLVLERAGEAQGLAGNGLTIVSESDAGSNRKSLREIAGALGIDTKKALSGEDRDAAVQDSAAGGEDRLPLKSGRVAKYGVRNVKHVALDGPLGLSVGFARDADARAPELTAELSFVAGTWKLTGLVPAP